MKADVPDGDSSETLDPRKLAVFVHIAESGSLTKSAVALGVAHSGLSRQIQELERKFGDRLFQRTGRGVLLTEVGKTLLPRAKKILFDLRQLDSDMRAMNGTISGSVNVGLPTSIAELLVGPLFERLRAAAPHLHIRLFEGFSGSVMDMLSEGRIEIGMFFAKRPKLKLGQRILCVTNLCLVGPAGDRLTAARTIGFSRVARLPLILPGMPHAVRSLIEETCIRHGFRANVPFEIDSFSTMRALVAAGGGYYTVSSYDSVARDVASGRLQAARIVSPEIDRPLIIAPTCQRPLTRAARVVLDNIETLVHDLVRKGRWQGRLP